MKQHKATKNISIDRPLLIKVQKLADARYGSNFSMALCRVLERGLKVLKL